MTKLVNLKEIGRNSLRKESSLFFPMSNLEGIRMSIVLDYPSRLLTRLQLSIGILETQRLEKTLKIKQTNSNGDSTNS